MDAEQRKKQTVSEFLSDLKARKAYVQDVTQPQSAAVSLTYSSTDVKRYSRRDSAEGLTKEEARSQAAAYTR